MIPFPARSVQGRRHIWSPKDLASAKFWLSASAGVALSGANLTSWTDQCSGIVCTPTGTAPTYDPYGIGGEFPGIKFSGSTLPCAVGPLLNGATSYAIIVVCQDTTNVTNTYYMFEYGTVGFNNPGEFCCVVNFPGVSGNVAFWSPQSGGANNYYTDADTTTLTTMSLLTFACDTSRSSDEVRPIRLNAEDVSGTRNANVNSSGALGDHTLYIGSDDGGGTTQWPGTIGEFLILVNPAVGDIAACEAYFQ